MIEASALTKRYGTATAVDGIDFTVQSGRVTGFLGPNGAGKSTTMRLIMGLDRPDSGSVTVNGRRYRDHLAPLREVGVLLDAKAVHSGRSARNHLRALAATHRIGDARVDEVIELTGLSSVAGKRVGGFSLGMGQRLGIAAALLGDPATIILDEPVNGLDPEGVRWVRLLVRSLAAEGRTVLLSSHLMSEMAQTADHLIVLGRGRVVADAPVEEILRGSVGAVRVATPRPVELGAALADAGATIAPVGSGELDVSGWEAAAIGDLAARLGIPLHALVPASSSLEEAYLALTDDAVQYRTSPDTTHQLEKESAR